MRITRDDYHRGKDYFTDQSQDLFERYYMKMPSERRKNIQSPQTAKS